MPEHTDTGLCCDTVMVATTLLEPLSVALCEMPSGHCGDHEGFAEGGGVVYWTVEQVVLGPWRAAST